MPDCRRCASLRSTIAAIAETSFAPDRITFEIVEMARPLGIRSVGEGVETEEEFDWVRYHGADFVQGFLFARTACPPLRPAARRAQADQLTAASR